ncbi:MAG: patatin family protein, partial [Firmicutes bacterium]|nr:patatin family protein [Bacillota bacterium]
NDRWKKYNAQLGVVELLEQEGRIFVVRPSETIKISRLEKDPEVLQAMYDLGVKDAKTRLEDMIQYLNP